MTSDGGGTTGTIRVTRRAAVGAEGDRLRRYRVLVDGREVARLRQGETHEARVAPGTHVVEARIDWSGSAPADVTVGEGGTVTVLVEPGVTMTSFVRQLFRRTGWLTIKVVPE